MSRPPVTSADVFLFPGREPAPRQRQMTLPFGPPLAPMLARLAEAIPREGDWRYEPKWDGFRAIVWVDGDDLQITSRDKRPFLRYFPELEEPLRAALPETAVVDGEIVIAGRGKLDFDSLLLRIHPADSRIRMLAAETPASFIAFDLLARGSEDLRSHPLHERRTGLETIFAEPLTGDGAAGVLAQASGSNVWLTPHSGDVDDALRWFDSFEGLGLDGLIAKPADLPYLAGERAMTKIKHRRTVDCVVAGYRLSKTGDGVGSLLLGLYDDSGVLHYVGHTSSFKAPERRRLLDELKALQGEGGFGAGRTPGGPSRWTGAQDKDWVPLRPELVCEVSYDHMQGHRFRHAARLERWRPEKPPTECKVDQLTSPERRRR